MAHDQLIGTPAHGDLVGWRPTGRSDSADPDRAERRLLRPDSRGSVARSRGYGRSIWAVGDGENQRPMTTQYLRCRLQGSERPKPHQPVIVSGGNPVPVMIEYALEYCHALE